MILSLVSFSTPNIFTIELLALKADRKTTTTNKIPTDKTVKDGPEKKKRSGHGQCVDCMRNLSDAHLPAN